MHLIGELAHLLLHLYYRHEFPVLFALILVEEAGIPLPVPGDTLVMLSASKPHQGPFYPFLVIAISSVAVFFGSNVLYFMTRRGGRPLLDKYGKYIHLNQQRVARIEGWFRRHGPPAIIFGRLIPGLRIPTTVMAGLSNVPYSVYAPTDAVAAVVWSAVFYWAGALIYRQLDLLAGVLSGIADLLSIWVILGLLAAILLAGSGTWHIQRRVRRRRRQKAEEAEPVLTDSPV
ncbi:MAG TPA: DedA family protein [Ktedonobacterales bacterium]|nr:DedA family protein [Ktedonobacterales bacterium]